MERRNFLKKLGFGAAALIPGAAILAKGSAKAAATEAIPIPTLPPKEIGVIPEYWAKESLRILMEQEEYRKTISRDRREITDEGLNEILDVVFTGKQPETTYAGLIDDAQFTATCSDDTVASHPGWRALNEACVPLNQDAGADHDAQFDITASATVRGSFLIQGDKLISTQMFATPVNVTNGDTIKVSFNLE